ncbi:MAG: BREX system P-loop protein BrxC, partial [Deltaproteobacteria bacterium]
VGDIRTYLQTDKYIRLKNTDSAPQTLKRILSERADENRTRRERLKSLLHELIVEADGYALGQALILKASSAANIVAEALNYLIENLYTKLSYLQGLTDDPLREIRSTLVTDDVGQGQFSMDGTESNPEAYKEVRQYIDLSTAKNHRVMLNELVEKFTRKPYGWPGWEVVLLIARLVMAGEITLKAEGGAITPKQAIDYLSKSVKWKQVAILKRKTTSAADLNQARKLGQEVFGKIGPDSEDGLYRFLKEQLTGWQQSLGEYRSLASTGKYPGGKEAEAGTSLAHKLIDIADSYEFFTTFIATQEDLLDLSEDLLQLTDFFEKQRPTWDRLQEEFSTFEQNRADLEKESSARKALVRMAEILQAPSPYSMLQETDKLVEAVKLINDRLVAEKKNYVIKAVDKGISQVKEILDKYQANSDLSNQSLKPLQDVRKLVESTTSIPAIAYGVNQLRDAVDASIDLIEQEKGVGDMPLKPIKDISPTSIQKKVYLESDQDIEEFLTDLRVQLQSTLSLGVRIRIK